MMTEDEVIDEIEKLTAAKASLIANLNQTEGALAAMKVVLDPTSLDEAPDAAEDGE